MHQNGFDWNAYQLKATDTAIYPDRGKILGLLYACLGLNGESGEVAEHAKKMHRDDAGRMTDARRPMLRLELGDVLWYSAAAATEAKIKLASCWIREPGNQPEIGGYTGQGSGVGIMYCAAKLNVEAAKVLDIALRLLPSHGREGEDWTTSSQARTARQLIQTGIGRTLFYANRLAQDSGFTLELVAEENLSKLSKREAMGTLRGSGSSR